MRVGAELKAARKKAGLTVEVISNRTKISVSKLFALEKNDFKNLPTGLYLFSAVRAYAREVRIDPEPLVERLRADFAEGDSLDALQALDAKGALGAKNVADAGRSKSNPLRLAAIAAAVVLMTAGVGAYLHSIGLLPFEVSGTTVEFPLAPTVNAPSEAPTLPLSSPAPETTIATAVNMPREAADATHSSPPTETRSKKPRTAAVTPERQEAVATELPSPARIEEPVDRAAQTEELRPDPPVPVTAP